MTSPQEQADDIAKSRKALRLLRECDSAMAYAVQAQGCRLKGFSVRLAPEDCLITVRADFEGKQMVAFVGATTLSNALLKVTRDAVSGKLKWRDDRFAK